MKKIFLILVLFVATFKLYSQSQIKQNNAVLISLGYGNSEGTNESGNGIIYGIGWEKELGINNKIFLSSNYLIGDFDQSISSSDRNKIHKANSIKINIKYNLLRFKHLDLFVSGGGFYTHTKNLRNAFLDSNYYGVNIFSGIRFRPSNIKYNVDLILFDYSSSLDKKYSLNSFSLKLGYNFLK